MAINLPYLSSPGTLTSALNKIKKAQTPDRFTRDFLHTVLQMKGGSANAVIPYLKKVGFLNSDGTPTSIYERFRNPATSGAAAAEAMQKGYAKLYQANAYAQKLSDADLKGLIVQITGSEKGSSTVDKIFRTFRKLQDHADFEAQEEEPSEASPTKASVQQEPVRTIAAQQGLNLSYTINLNLPATTNIEVFHAIFRSLRQHLLED